LQYGKTSPHLVGRRITYASLQQARQWVERPEQSQTWLRE
jgi:hypothetical protein